MKNLQIYKIKEMIYKKIMIKINKSTKINWCNYKMNLKKKVLIQKEI